jgi:hypothetical protein
MRKKHPSNFKTGSNSFKINNRKNENDEKSKRDNLNISSHISHFPTVSEGDQTYLDRTFKTTNEKSTIPEDNWEKFYMDHQVGKKFGFSKSLILKNFPSQKFDEFEGEIWCKIFSRLINCSNASFGHLITRILSTILLKLTLIHPILEKRSRRVRLQGRKLKRRNKVAQMLTFSK